MSVSTTARFLVLVALGTLASGCVRRPCCSSPEPTTQQQATRGEGTVVGYVVDQHHKALPGLPVTLCSPAIGSWRTTTDAHGAYRFEGMPPGAYELCTELSTVARASATLTLRGPSTLSHELLMRLPAGGGIQLTAQPAR